MKTLTSLPSMRMTRSVLWFLFSWSAHPSRLAAPSNRNPIPRALRVHQAQAEWVAWEAKQAVAVWPVLEAKAVVP